MPVFTILDVYKSFAFDRPRQHDRRTIGGQTSDFVSRLQMGNTVSIHGQRLPAEGLPAGLVDIQMTLQHGRLALTQTIDVDGRAEIAQAVESGPLRGLPDRAFGRFAVAHQHIHPLVGQPESLRMEGDPQRDR